MKEELFYHRGRKTEHYTMEELKFMAWRYFTGATAGSARPLAGFLLL